MVMAMHARAVQHNVGIFVHDNFCRVILDGIRIDELRTYEAFDIRGGFIHTQVFREIIESFISSQVANNGPNLVIAVRKTQTRHFGPRTVCSIAVFDPQGITGTVCLCGIFRMDELPSDCHRNTVTTVQRLRNLVRNFKQAIFSGVGVTGLASRTGKFRVFRRSCRKSLQSIVAHHGSLRIDKERVIYSCRVHRVRSGRPK